MRQISRSDAPWAGLAPVCATGFAFSANYTNHAPLVSALTSEFHFTLAAAGLLTTGIFLAHAAMQIPGGHLADRFGSRPVLTWALAVVCLGNAGLGLATAYWQLLFWKVFVGLGTGASFVAGARYITTRFAAARLHVVMGCYGGSIVLGSGFVIFAVPLLFAAIGWRGSFFATAATAAAAAIAWILLAPPPPAPTHQAAPATGMLWNRQLWLLGVAQMASFGLVIVVGVWVTAYLSQTFHLKLAEAGRIGSLTLVLGIVSRPLGGALVPRLHARPTLQIGLALSALACFDFGMGKGSLAQAGTGILLLGIGAGLPYTALFNRAAALYPARSGAAMGLMNTIGIVMILAAPPLIGRAVEWSGNFQSSFLALGVFTLLALLASCGIDFHEPDRSV